MISIYIHFKRDKLMSKDKSLDVATTLRRKTKTRTFLDALNIIYQNLILFFFLQKNVQTGKVIIHILCIIYKKVGQSLKVYHIRIIIIIIFMNYRVLFYQKSVNNKALGPEPCVKPSWQNNSIWLCGNSSGQTGRGVQTDRRMACCAVALAVVITDGP